MANVSQLQPAFAPQVQTSSSEAQEKDADFLALRLVNKHARLRLSPEPIDLTPTPSKATLFAILNSKGWFVAATQEPSGASALVFSPLAHLRSALAGASTDDEKSFKPQRRLPISGTPHILTFACDDTRMLLGLVDGSIHVYSSDHLLSGGEDSVRPVHVFTSSSRSLLSIQPNPGDMPELIAVLRDCTSSPGALAVELLDVQKLTSSGGWMAGKSPSTTPTSVSWSPKGKQLALGLQSGDIVTFSPTATATPKSSIPHPPSANNMSILSVQWLSATSFHTVYAPPGQLTPDSEQIHYHTSLDSKNNSVQDIKFNNPYLPFPGLRLPGEFLVCLRDWNPSKALLFIGDSTSSDIGLIGSVASDSRETWHNLSLEETSTPSLPLDKEQNDTILLGMDVDLTSTDPYHHSTASGEALELPAHPILYVYASDGTVLGWHVLNVTGAPYPGMVLAVDTLASSFDTLSSLGTSQTAFDKTESNPVPEQPSSLQFQTMASDPVVKTEGTVSAFSFGTPSSLGMVQSAFGKIATTSVFGQPSAFEILPKTSEPVVKTEDTASTSLFGAPSPLGMGQSAFSRGGAPSVFGQPTFGFSLGQSQIAAPAFGKPSLGTFSGAALPATTSANTNAGGAFSVFASSTQSAFAVAAAKNTSTKPVWAATTPTQPSPVSSSDIPTASSSGSGGFMKFSEPVTPAPSGAFGTFASGAQSAFALAAAKNTAAKPVWATLNPSTTATPAQPPPVSSSGTPTALSGGGGFAVFSTPAMPVPSKVFGALAPSTESAFAAAARNTSTKVAWATPSPTTIATPTQLPRASGSDAPSVPSSTRDVIIASPAPATSIPSGTFSEFSSGTQSAFAAAAAKNTSAKPVWVAPDPTTATPTQPPPASGSDLSSVLPSTSGGFVALSAPATPAPSGPFSALATVAAKNVTAKAAWAPPTSVTATPTQPPPVSGGDTPGVSSCTGGGFTTFSTTVTPAPSVAFGAFASGASAFAAAAVKNASAKPIWAAPSPLSVAATPAQSQPMSGSGRFGVFPSGTGGFVTFSAPATPAPAPPVSGSGVSSALPPGGDHYDPSPRIEGEEINAEEEEASEVSVSVVDEDEAAASEAADEESEESGGETETNKREEVAALPQVAKEEVVEENDKQRLGMGATGKGAAPEVEVVTQPPAMPSLSRVGSSIPPPSPRPMPPKIVSPAPVRTPTPEQGMQAECTLLFTTIGKELENLSQLATAASAKSAELRKTSNLPHQKADLGDPSKWAFGDIEEYGRVLLDLKVDIKELKVERVCLRKSLKELDSNMLKINTRKEEIARFNKAKTDAEFTKMSKIRTLPPEYSETQSQLRKSIRAIKDRVQKLEDHLQASKKRINEVRTGRPSIRPPSLDTVNRTFRNIDIAIDQQKQEICQLRHRVAKLDISNGRDTRDQPIVSSLKRPMNVTPNVAATTAAALNAERYAQRLKKALLASRTQPLLNLTATASPLPMSFQTPQKDTVVKPDVGRPDVKMPESVSALPAPPMSFPPSLPTWTPPPPGTFESPATHDVTPSRNRGGTKHHQKPILLRKNASPASSTTQSPFEWKPVEPVRPASSLPFALRPAGSN